MKKIVGIGLVVQPCTNDGYIVTANVETLSNKDNVNADPKNFIEAMYGKSETVVTLLRYYAQDSQHVGMYIQEIIDNSNMNMKA